MGHHERAVEPDALPTSRATSIDSLRFQIDFATWYARIAGVNSDRLPSNGDGRKLSPTPNANHSEGG